MIRAAGTKTDPTDYYCTFSNIHKTDCGIDDTDDYTSVSVEKCMS